MKFLTSILAAVCGFLAQLFRARAAEAERDATPEGQLDMAARRATEQAKSEATAAERAAATEREIASEVRDGKTDAVNARLANLLKAIAFVAMLSGAGCVSREVVYVAEVDKVIPMQYQGRPGWWVPEHQMVRIMTAMDKASKMVAEKREAP